MSNPSTAIPITIDLFETLKKKDERSISDFIVSTFIPTTNGWGFLRMLIIRPLFWIVGILVIALFLVFILSVIGVPDLWVYLIFFGTFLLIVGYLALAFFLWKRKYKYEKQLIEYITVDDLESIVSRRVLKIANETEKKEGNKMREIFHIESSQL